MGTSANPMAGQYFNDPHFAAAVSNLAGAFAPPSADEYLTAEKVKGERFQNTNLADLYANGGGLDPYELDRRAALLGAWAPNQGFNAVNMADSTTRRGQDVTAETSRYNTVAGGLIDRASTPLTHDQAMPEINDGLADFIGGPVQPSVSGAALGAPAPPLSETEMIAQIMAQQSPEGQRALLDPSTVQTLDANGDAIYTSEIDAIGQPAYNPTGGQAAPDLLSYRTADGREGTAIFDPNTQTIVDASTKQPLPEGAQTYKLQGGDKAAMTGATTSNITEGNRIIAESAYGKQRASKFLALIEANPGVLGIPGTIRGFAQDIVAGAGEFGAAYGESVGSLEEVQALAAQVAQSSNYTPEIAQAFNYALEMAYLAANMQDPGGEVGIRELATNLSQYDGGIAGNEKVKATLAVLIGQMDDRAAFGAALRDGTDFASPNPAGVGTPPPAAAPATAPAATPAPGTRLRFDANGDPIP